MPAAGALADERTCNHKRMMHTLQLDARVVARDVPPLPRARLHVRRRAPVQPEERQNAAVLPLDVLEVLRRAQAPPVELQCPLQVPLRVQRQVEVRVQNAEVVVRAAQPARRGIARAAPEARERRSSTRRWPRSTPPTVGRHALKARYGARRASISSAACAASFAPE